MKEKTVTEPTILVCDPHYARDSSMMIIRDGKVLAKWKAIDTYDMYEELENPRWDVDKAIIEGQYFSRNWDTTIKLATARGKVEGILELYGIPHTDIKPMVWHRYHGIAKNCKNYSKSYHKSVYKRVAKIIDDKCVDLIECYLMYMYYTERKLGEE